MQRNCADMSDQKNAMPQAAALNLIAQNVKRHQEEGTHPDCQLAIPASLAQWETLLELFVAAGMANERQAEKISEMVLDRPTGVLKDAERYRWMRANDWDSPIVKLDYDDYHTLKGEALDAAIDEAMKT